MSPGSPDTPPSDQQVLLQAVRAVLAPLAGLAVEQGLPYAAVEDALRRAFVDAAKAAQLAQGLPEHRLVSRISAATGINRREVTRLTQAEPDAPLNPQASLASQLFTRWVSDPSLRVRGKLKALPRVGEVSFESLARSITQDVHTRTLLDELVRLKLAHWDTEADTVALIDGAFTPHGDLQDLLSFLGQNVGDHLQSAVDNVLSSESLHFEQAVFARGLPAAAVDGVRQLARRHWQALMTEAVPLLEAAQQDAVQAASQARTAATPPPETHRVRLGLFTYHAPAVPASPQTPPATQTGATRRRAPNRS